ncbi:MAG: RraA family protein, partial [Candidatus Eremiobacteraeota bacterium]|nr:RraA family protein [Candidatus Eremiobacteraeota bacterium]
TTPGTWKGRGKQSDLWRLLEKAPKPAIVVLQHPGPHPERASVFGDVVATIAQRLGAVGLVTDGSVRDFPAIMALRFGVWARGTVTSRGNGTTLAIGEEVSISGMQVGQGDLIYADTNGVVAIPKGLGLEELLAEVERVRKSDAERVRMILSPEFSIDRL